MTRESKEASPDPTLEEATLDQILGELKKRYECYLLALSRRTNDIKEDKDEIQVWYTGGFICGLGLATAARAYLEEDFLKKG